MNISLKVEGVAELQERLSTLKRSTAKKAVTTWANWVGIEAQGEMRNVLPQRFKMRGTLDGFRKAIVFQSATQSGDRMVKAELKVGGQGFGQSRTQNLGVILARHENAETRRRTSGGGLADLVRINGGKLIEGGFFVPANNLRTSSQNPPKQLYPRAIGVQMRADASNKMFFAKGTKGKGASKVSYFATEKGIFRRRATRAAGTRATEAIWWFKRTVSTPARLGLWETADQVLNTRAVALGIQAIEETIWREMQG